MVTIGLDEVGRGCWAGPLVAAAVALSNHQDGPSGLRDSKKLSRQQRERLDVDIRSHAKAYGVGWVTPGEVDSLGLTQAVSLAMHRAMLELRRNFPACVCDEIIIDGNYNFLAHKPGAMPDLTHLTEAEEAGYGEMARTLVHADATVPAVSAASIIAKVARDTYMRELAQAYPAYGFESHVGYGTSAHHRALKQHGITPIHRQSYKPIMALMSHP